MKLPAQLLWFCVAGAIGFVVDAGLLHLLRPSFGLFAGRAVSFLAAVVTTWALNRSLTFRTSRSSHSPDREFAVYLLLMLGGGLVNYGVYAWVVTTSAIAASYPVIGVAAGTAAGMAVNFCSMRFLLFRHPARVAE